MGTEPKKWSEKVKNMKNRYERLYPLVKFTQIIYSGGITMQKQKLIAHIESLSTKKGMKTKFYLLLNGQLKDVTLTLYDGIKEYNKQAKQSMNNGHYQTVIPYNYSNGLITYSFGCGLTHYLQQYMFPTLMPYISEFDITQCSLQVLTPQDVKMFRESNTLKNIIAHYV